MDKVLYDKSIALVRIHASNPKRAHEEIVRVLTGYSQRTLLAVATRFKLAPSLNLSIPELRDLLARTAVGA